MPGVGKRIFFVVLAMEAKRISKEMWINWTQRSFSTVFPQGINLKIIRISNGWWLVAIFTQAYRVNGWVWWWESVLRKRILLLFKSLIWNPRKSKSLSNSLKMKKLLIMHLSQPHADLAYFSKTQTMGKWSTQPSFTTLTKPSLLKR